jgi:hypothetical protein
MMATNTKPPDEASDGRHPGAAVEEWVFAAWTDDASLGVVSGHRIVGRRAWYWAALARHGRPLLHVADFEVPVRADPFIVKGEALWAEHHCVAPAQQWSIGNETFAAALEDPDEALGRGYGDPTPIAFDLEWYAVDLATRLEPNGVRAAIEFGDEQGGVVHGSIEILGEPTVELVEVPARRWHRWSADGVDLATAAEGFGPLTLPEVAAHTGVRAPFAFPDGNVSDLVLTPLGWAQRGRAQRNRPARPDSTR